MRTKVRHTRTRKKKSEFQIELSAFWSSHQNCGPAVFSRVHVPLHSFLSRTFEYLKVISAQSSMGIRVFIPVVLPVIARLLTHCGRRRKEKNKVSPTAKGPKKTSPFKTPFSKSGIEERYLYSGKNIFFGVALRFDGQSREIRKQRSAVEISLSS